MKREGREVWEQRVRRLAESGLTAKEFADELGVNVHTLNGWKWKLTGGIRQAEEVSARASSARFIEVVAPQSAPTVEAPGECASFEVVVRGGAVIRVPPRFDAQALRALVAALEVR